MEYILGQKRKVFRRKKIGICKREKKGNVFNVKNSKLNGENLEY